MYVNLNLELSSRDDKAIAGLVFNTFLANYENHVRKSVTENAELESWKAANAAMKAKWDEESGGLGFGPELPYKEASIEFKKQSLERSKQEEADAKAIVQFLARRFLGGFGLPTGNFKTEEKP